MNTFAHSLRAILFFKGCVRHLTLCVLRSGPALLPSQEHTPCE